MRILVHIEPLVMHGRPFHYWAWLARAAAFARALSGRGHTFRFLLNQALAEGATAPFDPARARDPDNGQGLAPEWIVPVLQEEVRRHFDAPNVAILDGFHHERWPASQVAAAGATLRGRLAGFAPDVILTYTPAPHLASAFPDALMLHTENGMFSRAPFPPTQYFDPLGLYARSVPGAHARELLARTATQAERAWLDRLRATYRAWLTAASPFHGLERALRRRHARLALLPLQFGGEAGFELNGPFRNQGEFLFHVLERLPHGVGLMVTEHPTAHWLGDVIDRETRAWVRARWPQVMFVDHASAAHGSQMVMLHVDDVIGYSSSLALQAMFWQKPLFAVGSGLPLLFATAAGVEHIDPARPLGDVADRDGAVAWLMRHYFVPETLCLNDGDWIERFLATSLERHAAGSIGLDFFEPVADEATLTALHTPPQLSPMRGPIDPDLLKDGAFEQWKGAPTSERLRHWTLIAGEANSALVSRGDATDGPCDASGTSIGYARIERSGAGTHPTLLLQRIPDLDVLSGTWVTLGFWARGTPRARLCVYFYQQFAHPDGPRHGTAATSIELEETWRHDRYTVTLPEAPAEPRGAGHHTEVVFLLEAAPGESRLELAAVTLDPGQVDF